MEKERHTLILINLQLLTENTITIQQIINIILIHPHLHILRILLISMITHTHYDEKVRIEENEKESVADGGHSNRNTYRMTVTTVPSLLIDGDDGGGGNMKRSSSELSFFTPRKLKKKDDHTRTIWKNMNQNERIEAVLPYVDEKGRGILSIMVRKKCYDIVSQLLLTPECNVNQQDRYANTPLHHAVLVGDMRMVSLLVESIRVKCNIHNVYKHSFITILVQQHRETSLMELCCARALIDDVIDDYCMLHNGADILESLHCNDKSAEIMNKIRRTVLQRWVCMGYDQVMPITTHVQNQIVLIRLEHYTRSKYDSLISL